MQKTVNVIFGEKYARFGGGIHAVATAQAVTDVSQWRFMSSANVIPVTITFGDPTIVVGSICGYKYTYKVYNNFTMDCAIPDVVRAVRTLIADDDFQLSLHKLA
jgi:hypothetical protein